LTFFFNNIK